MDKEAFAKVRHYFRHDFLENRTLPTSFKNDFLEQAFKAMVREDVLRDYRESFFQRACDRIRAISLKKDIVMPTGGVIKALGKASGKILEELDFPFAYSHQIPFPTHSPYRSGPDQPSLSFHIHEGGGVSLKRSQIVTSNTHILFLVHAGTIKNR